MAFDDNLYTKQVPAVADGDGVATPATWSAQSKTVTSAATWTVNVGAVSLEGSDNADLTALSYSIDGGASVAVPNFDKNTTDYKIWLPSDTEKDKTISLTGTLDDYNATSIATTATSNYYPDYATLTVTAENGTTTKSYTIEFEIETTDDDTAIKSAVELEAALDAAGKATEAADKTVTMTDNITIGSGETLTVPEGVTLNTGDFALTIENGGTIRVCCGQDSRIT